MHRPPNAARLPPRAPSLVRRAGLAAWAVLAAGCGADRPAADLTDAAWEDVEKAARGQTVTWMMWQGDPYINAYVQGYVAPQLRQRYGITLNTVSGQGGDIVAILMTEKESGKAASEVDLMWINGETFYQLRQIDALQGPFTDRLPHARLIDFSNPFIKYDFQQEVNGYECPWGNVQLALIYDTKRVADPPRTRQSLLAWTRAHPARFTFDTAFTGMTFLKSLLIDIAGGPATLAGRFDRTKYELHSAALWAYLNELKPHLWKRGETYPTSVAQLHQLFTSGEVDFTMSNNDGEVDNKVVQGLFPDTARAYVLDGGTIQNTHYVGIPRHSRHLAGALVTANFLISPEAQFEKAKPAVWGDGTVLALPLLDKVWQERFRNIPQRTHSPTRESIQDKALPELAPEYMIRIHEDFRRHVLGS